ncbi:MAG: 1-acyl-sn-glycerol-3-phosphate acyltransferase [Myxococcota bacterium]
MKESETIYLGVVRTLRFVSQRYFRDVQVTGREHVPPTGGGVLVSWHPNGLVDPALIFTYCPRRVIFGARDGLLRFPGLGRVLRALGTVPIYRSIDPGNEDPAARRAANARSLETLARAVASGGLSCLFPEGDSHDAPYLLDLKTGAARFFRQAWHQRAPGQPAPLLLPVGLHYDRKDAAGSNVLVAFHPAIPVEVPPPAGEGDDAIAWDDQMTALIEETLREVVHATESWRLHFQLHRLRELVRAERVHRAGSGLAAADIHERTLGYARVWSAYARLKHQAPEALAQLIERVAVYQEDLHALGLTDRALDAPPSFFRRGVVALLVAQVMVVFVILPPLMVLGVVVHLPPALALWGASQAFSKRQKDVATIQMLLAMLLFPLAWAVTIGVTLWARQQMDAMVPSIPDAPALAAITVVGLSIIGAMAALRYLRLVRETARAARIRLTRSRRRVAIAALKVERAEIHDAFLALTAELDLPGAVQPDGRVVDDESRQDEPGWQR